MKKEVFVLKPEEKNCLEALKDQGIFPQECCQGKGFCGKCRIRFIENAPLPVKTERRFFSPKELREGWRLACLHRADKEYQVEASFETETKLNIVTKAAKFKDRSYVGESTGGSYIIAVDLGTTTVAMEARSLKDDSLLAQYCVVNPQRHFGADVLSRMQAAEEGKAEDLQECIKDALEEGILSLIEKLGKEPDGIFLAGNTVMEHMLAGLPTGELSRFPFKPVTLEEQKIELAGRKVILLPGISAFVGADITAGLLCCGFAETEKLCLFIDLGTNGEMALGNKEKLLCTATAAGPAFEGGAGQPGADMVAILAELLDSKKMDETGLLAEPWFTEGVNIKGTYITQRDIRELQMAKAAVYAGICALTRNFDAELADIDKVYLAGGFGYYLDPEKAARIGLFPGELKEKVEAVGNTSLAGAYLYGKEKLLKGISIKADTVSDTNASEKQKAADLAQLICKLAKSYNLAQWPDFEEVYVENMYFPED